MLELTFRNEAGTNVEDLQSIFTPRVAQTITANSRTLA
jgi:hypothetical protein